jgi:hypothetical protein
LDHLIEVDAENWEQFSSQMGFTNMYNCQSPVLSMNNTEMNVVFDNSHRLLFAESGTKNAMDLITKTAQANLEAKWKKAFWEKNSVEPAMLR